MNAPAPRKTRRHSAYRSVTASLLVVMLGSAAVMGAWRLATIVRPSLTPEPPPPALTREASHIFAKALPGAPKPAALSAIERLTYDELKFGEHRPDLWARLAYVEVLRHGMLETAGQADLRRSYATAAIDPEIGFWRIQVAYNNWSRLSPDLKKAARAETKALQRDWRNRARLAGLAKNVSDPVGRLVLTLTLSQVA